MFKNNIKIGLCLGVLVPQQEQTTRSSIEYKILIKSIKKNISENIRP